MNIASEIFREYDVRGVVGADLDSHVAYELGRAAGTYVRRGGGERVVVGRDCRLSGEKLARALSDGLNHSGVSVVDVGVVPTPVLYWAIQSLGFDGGIQITGSHNPPEYNGFKLTLLGQSLHGPDIQALRRLIEQQDYEVGEAHRDEQQVLNAYMDDVLERLDKLKRPLKVVVDAGNGVGGMTAVDIYERMGCEVVSLYCDPDGQFPNHHPDPTVEANLRDLRQTVVEQAADLGIGFDGDGDRIGVVDGQGEVIWGDQLTAILAASVLKEAPGSTVIGEVKCSQAFYDAVEARGGKAIMWRTGHSLIKAKMKEVGAALAGEMSGHIFFKHRYYGFDDAAYAGGRLLEVVANGGRSLAELRADWPDLWSTPEIRFECPESIKFRLVDEVVQFFKEGAASEGYRVIDIDGARVEWDDAWGLVRCSNTQPLLVMRFEAQTKERLEDVMAQFRAVIDERKQMLTQPLNTVAG